MAFQGAGGVDRAGQVSYRSIQKRRRKKKMWPSAASSLHLPTEEVTLRQCLKRASHLEQPSAISRHKLPSEVGSCDNGAEGTGAISRAR